MQETTGTVVSWDEDAGGEIRGDDDEVYRFTKKEWAEDYAPQVGGAVRVICQNGRDATTVETILIEHMPRIKMTARFPDGNEAYTVQSRFIGGPRRMRSDALAWMHTAKWLHGQFGKQEIDNIGSLLLESHPLISFRGSVIKYCYGFAIELYLKWILTEAKIPYRSNHKVGSLGRKLPARVLDNLRTLYKSHLARRGASLKMMIADANSTRELECDWSTFDQFVTNIEHLKFIIGRYATPEEYSIMPSSSERLSREMNIYIDSDDFFVLGLDILSYEPDLADYEET